MAPPAPIHCYAPNCDFVTPAEVTTIAQALQFMTLHVQAAHPVPVQAVPSTAVTRGQFDAWSTDQEFPIVIAL